MTYLTKSPALWTCSIMLVPSNMAEFLFQKSKNKFNSKFKSLFLSWWRKTCCRRGRKHVQEAVELLGSPKKLFVLNFFLNKPISVEEILCRHNIESWLVKKSSYDCCCCALENIYVGWQEREGPDSGRWPPVAICFFVIWCYTFTTFGAKSFTSIFTILPRVKISQRTTPYDQTSDWLE